MTERDTSAELKQLSHDVRNALNGVSVNLEVARSRAQGGADVAQVAPFLETAAQQLDLAARLHKMYTDATNRATDAAIPRDSHASARAADDTPSHP